MLITNYNISLLLRSFTFLIFTFIIATATANDHKTIIKMATLAPNGSPWHEILKEMGVQWREASRGQVELRIYPGGTAGDEGAMVRKMRIGQLQGAMITNTGLANISPAINAMIIPMAADTHEKLDRVWERIGQRLIKHFDEKGFIILNCFDAGWVRFFVSDENPSIASVRKAKMFVWAGDDRIVELWKNAGFNAVPLSITDILPALQTGMVNAYPCTAVMALASQWFALTPYMIDMPWAPLVGATVINKQIWEQIPESIKPELQRIASVTRQKLQSEVRVLEIDAITEMQKRGLTVLTLSDTQMAEWRNTIISVWPKMRGEIVPDYWYDAMFEAVRE